MQKKEQFEELYLNHYGQMLKLARWLLKDDEEAKDVVDDIFTEVWDGNINPYVAKTENFLLVCIRNRCLDILGRLKIKERVRQLLTLESPLVMMPANDYHQQELDKVREIVDKLLTPRDRQVLLMKYERRMKYHEMAVELGISEAAIYKHLSQALKTLKDNLKKNEYGNE